MISLYVALKVLPTTVAGRAIANAQQHSEDSNCASSSSYGIDIFITYNDYGHGQKPHTGSN